MVVEWVQLLTNAWCLLIHGQNLLNVVSTFSQDDLALEADYGAFSKDSSFLLECSRGGSSTSSNFRFRGGLNHGRSHGGHGGRARRGGEPWGVCGNQFLNQEVFPASFDNAAFPELRSASVSNSHGNTKKSTPTFQHVNLHMQSESAVSKVHGKDGAANAAQMSRGSAEFFSSKFSNDKESIVPFHHDLSDLLLKTRLDDLIEGDDDVAIGEASTHNCYSAQSWAERAEKGEYIPQAAMNLEAAYGGFSEDPSFLVDSLNGGSSPPNLRGWESFNNGSMHGGHGGQAGNQD
ncbi:hypothetical protein F0562_001719 [Nyssa sinensis]|uniref:Uncharacterized protein n=1 Tax=Nyssa sinensis TaxID=561372 RepID=A0A5J5C3V0_9ASTE|nr:hypothetical protein F0562_001719 [Nyssa sinensis]